MNSIYILPKKLSVLIWSVLLITVAKPWRQPRCPLTEEWIGKMWFIDTMEYYPQKD